MALVCGIFGNISTVYAGEIIATDTIAGYSATIKILDQEPGKEFVFRIEKPDGSQIEISGESDESGVVEVRFLGFHTKNTGVYKVWHLRDRRSNAGPSAFFEVYPDSVSAAHSRIRILQETAAADGVEQVKVQVQLMDEYKNPISGHFVNLISSRSQDTIESAQTHSTDDFGEVLFYVTSETDGISRFSALDRNSGIVLEERGEAVFFKTKNSPPKGGHVYSASLFETQSVLFEEEDGGDGSSSGDVFGVIDHFAMELSSLSGNDTFHEPFTLKITAQDAENNTVKNYVGSIIITAKGPTDENKRYKVTLPNNGQEIEFRSEEQGVHVFDLGVKFSESGVYTLGVVEFEDGAFSDIEGSTTVEVLEGCTGSECNNDDDKDVEGDFFVIDRPKAGSTYGKKQVSIRGSIESRNNVRVFLDDEEVKTLVPDSSGVFLDEENIRVEKDGLHTIYFEDVDLERRSEAVEFMVDTAAPEFFSARAEPKKDLSPGDVVSVVVSSEKNLESVRVDIPGTNVSKKLVMDTLQLGKYSGTFRAPDVPGEYNIQVTLRDDLEHITVIEKAESIVVQSDIPLLSAPKNLSVNTKDGIATLLWDVPESRGTGIMYYRILSGATGGDLSSFDESEDREYSLEKITRGEGVFLAVEAVDTERNKSDRSNVVSVFLEKKEEPEVLIGPIDKDAGEINVDVDIDVLKNKGVEIIPGDGQLKVSWDEPKEEPAFFDIRFGRSSQQYAERFAVRGDQRSVTIPDLINGVPYYVTVVALNKDGTRSLVYGDKYEEKYALPLFTGLHSAAEYEPSPQLEKVIALEKNGTEVLFLLVLSFSFSAAMFFFQRAFRFF